MCTSFLLFLLTTPVAATNPAEPASGPTRAIPQNYPGDWFMESDYPADAWQNHLGGVVGFHLEIDQDGTLVECKIALSSGVASLDQVTCDKLMERARFAPARDASGKSIRDVYNGRITWRVPQSDNEP